MARRRNGKSNRLTCVDIARLAGVGPATVSRVLNRTKPVSRDVEERVLKAVQSTGYKPSRAASMLKRRTSETIGLITEVEYEHHHYGSQLIQGVSLALTNMGHHLAMGMVHLGAPAEEIENLPIAKVILCDGLIFDVTNLAGDIDATVNRIGIPYVFVNPAIPRPYNMVAPDDVLVAEESTQYLLDRGHRRIGFVPAAANTAHSSMRNRMRGYTRKMLDNDLRPIHLVEDFALRRSSSLDDWATQTKRCLLDDKCTGIVTYNAQWAARVFRVCNQLGRRIPEDVSIVSCDFDPIASFTLVPVTCFGLDRVKMGRSAVELLQWRIDNNGSDAPSIVVRPELIEGASVAPPRQE